MKGRKQKFTIGETTVTLARPSLSEMAEYEPIFRLLFEEPDYSDFNGDIDEVLAAAVADETDEDKAAFEQLQDFQDRIDLWDQWCQFAGVERFLLDRAAQKMQRVQKARKELYIKAGADPEQVDQFFKDSMTVSLLSTNASQPTTDSDLMKSTPSITGMLQDSLPQETSG